MTKQLNQIAEVSSGYSFRGSVPLDARGDMVVIQTGDILDDGTVRIDGAGRVNKKSVTGAPLLQNNDILLVSKGGQNSSFRSAVFDSTEPAIASVTLHVLRIKDLDIRPHYLCAYLNSPEGQRALQKIATGSSVRMLSLGELKDMQIPVPSMEVQKRFSDLVQNINKQRELLGRKQHLLEKVQKVSIVQLIK